jgi:hypothetical protein
MFYRFSLNDLDGAKEKTIELAKKYLLFRRISLIIMILALFIPLIVDSYKHK